MRIFAACVLASAAAALAAPARADTPDALVAPEAREPAVAPRAWVYLDDPTTPEAWRATTFARVTATGVGASPTRPFGADVAHPGSVFEVGGELGITRWLSVAATGYSSTFGASDAGSFGTMVGLRAAPLATSTTHVVLSGGFLRELSGGNGAWARVSLAQDIGRARLGTTVHGERIFADGRDAVDVMVMAGASYAVVGPLRVGVEYVAQDLEGAIDREEAEGGLRHFAGPTASVELMGKRLTINGGPAFGLSKGSPPVLGRVGVAYAF